MAHYERLLLLEGGLVLPRLASMLGLDSVAPYMPGIAAAEDVVPFVQVCGPVTE